MLHTITDYGAATHKLHNNLSRGLGRKRRRLHYGSGGVSRRCSRSRRRALLRGLRCTTATRVRVGVTVQLLLSIFTVVKKVTRVTVTDHLKRAASRVEAVDDGLAVEAGEATRAHALERGLVVCERG